MTPLLTANFFRFRRLPSVIELATQDCRKANLDFMLLVRILAGVMRYDVHFQSPLVMAHAGASPGDEPSSLDEFDQFYRYVGTFDAPDLESVVAKLQGGGGGLGDPTMQQYVMRHVQHTSITSGDIVIERDTGRIWFLDLWGWKQIQLP